MGSTLDIFIRPDRHSKALIFIYGIVVIVSASSLIGVLSDSITGVAGYPSVFLLNFLGSASIVVPR